MSRGEILAVMGPSGSGKSTLLHCLADILVPEEGEVWFDGQRLDAQSDERRSELRRGRFGFVFQTGQLVPELTAEENVALPLLLNGVRRAQAIGEARKWFARLGLDGLENRRSGELSGGQAQRVAGEGPGHQGRRLRRPGDHRPRRHDQHAHRSRAMIPLGLRLAIRGGRETVIRLVVLIAAVGLGTGLLLTAVAGINAVNIQNDASAWLWTGNSLEPSGPTTQGIAPLWWHVSGDEFAGQVITRADVAATGPSAPVPPGIPRDPGPGQYYASPALARLLASTPADELADRYPGHLACTIGDAVLQAPNSLVIIVGRTPAQLAHTPDTVRVTAIATTFPEFAKARNSHGLQAGPPIPRVQASGIDLMYASAEIQHPLAAPGTQYYVFVALGFAASLAIIAATFPLLRRITGPEVARNELRAAWRVRGAG